GKGQQDPKGEPEMLRQQRVGIGTHRIEGDVAEVEQAGQSDDDVEAPGQHHIDEDLDAEVIDILQRTLGTGEQDRDHRIDHQREKRELQEVLVEKALLLGDLENAGLRLGKLA